MILQSELRNIPVVCDLDEKRLVGSLSRAEALALFSEAIAEKASPLAKADGRFHFGSGWPTNFNRHIVRIPDFKAHHFWHYFVRAA